MNNQVEKLSIIRILRDSALELLLTFLMLFGVTSIVRWVIGLGEEKDLSLDSLRMVGRIAAREAVRLQAKHVAWAPVIRDEGNTVLDVGQGDRVFVEQMLSAYDTEKRLQAQALAPDFSIEDLVIEAGPTFFDSAVKQVSEGIESTTAELAQRNAAPYSSAKMQ